MGKRQQKFALVLVICSLFAPMAEPVLWAGTVDSPAAYGPAAAGLGDLFPQEPPPGLAQRVPLSSGFTRPTPQHESTPAPPGPASLPENEEAYVPSGMPIEELAEEPRLVNLNLRLPATDPAEAAQRMAALGGGHEAAPQANLSPAAEIQALAAGLDNDPRLIYEYVHNHFDFVPTWGLLKSPQETYLAKTGNAFDLAALLVSLLQAAGFETRYVIGTVQIPLQQAMNWVGVTNQAVLPWVFWDGGIGTAVSGDVLRINHVWVKVRIAATWYSLDPSFKAYTYKTGLDLAATTGYNRDAFLAATQTGSTVTADYVRSIHEANLNSRLTQYSTNLISYLRTDMPFASLADVIGGREIVPEFLVAYPTQLPYTVESVWGGEVVSLPAEYSYKLHIEVPGIDYWANVPDIAGLRVTIFYTGATTADQAKINTAGSVYKVYPAYQVNMKPELRVGGSLVASGTSLPLASWEPITLTLITPILDGQGNPWVLPYAPQWLRAGAWYALPLMLQTLSGDALNRQYQLLEESRAAGVADAADPVLGQSLHTIGLSYFHQTNASDATEAQIAGIVRIPHVRGMIMSQDLSVLEWQQIGGVWQPMRLGPAAYTIDVRLNWYAINSASGDANRERGFMTDAGHKSSAIEHATIEQLQNNPALSTIKVFDIANAQGLKIYHIVSTTVDAILPLLDYTTAVKDALRRDVNAGYEVTVPERNIRYNQWTGTAWLSFHARSGSAGYWLNGGLGSAPPGYEMPTTPMGGSASFTGTINFGLLGGFINGGIALGAGVCNGMCNAPSPAAPNNAGDDPVDTATGAFLHSTLDLAFGVLGQPIRFERTYASASCLQDGPLGFGWTHSYDLKLVKSTDWLRGFGLRLATDAVAAIVQDYVGLDIASTPMGGLPHQRLPIGTETADWVLGQVTQNLVTVTGIDGMPQQYLSLPDGSYSAAHGSTTRLVANPDGSYIEETKDGVRLAFDKNGKALHVTDANNNRTSFTYDGSNKLTRVTDAAGRSINLTYSGSRLAQITDPANRTYKYEYDPAGNLIRYTDARGNATRYNYDSQHRVTSIVDPMGIPAVTNLYDTLGRVASQRDGRGTATSFRYGDVRSTYVDGLGSATVYFYDAYRRLIGNQYPLGHTTTLVYDANDNVLASTDRRSQATRYAYDSRGNLILVTDPLSYTTSYAYDAQDNLIQATDALSRTALITYDARRNPLHATDALGNTTVRTYDWRGLVTAIQDANGHSTTSSYDGQGNMTRLSDPLGHATNMTYDVLGRMTRLTDPNGHSTQFAYDASDNLVTETSALGTVSTNAYDANSLLVSTTDALGRTMRFGYDGQFNLICVTDTLGNVTRYQYDANNRLAAITDANGHVTQQQRDALGRVTQTLDPLGRATRYTYDGAGNPLTETNADGNVLGYQYDADGRLTRVSYPDGSSLVYQYDAVHNITSMTRGSRQTLLAYDAVGRPVRTDLLADNIVLSMAYDRVGNLTGLQAGRTGTVLYNAQYTYDVADRLTAATDRISVQTVNYAYDNDDSLTTISYPGGARTTYAYDANHRTIRVETRDRNNGNLSTWAYRYDAVDNPTQITSTVGVVSLATSYAYDALGRLVRESYPRYSVDYSYDAVGNRVQLTGPTGVVTYTYDAADQLLHAGATVFGYDANGNQVLKTDAHGSFHFDYDYQNRLIRIAAPGERVTTFEYDPSGRRVGAGGAAGQSRSIYYGTEVILEEVADLASGVAYLYGNGSLATSRPMTGTNAPSLAYHGDALGNVVNLSDAAGLPRGAYGYDAFGHMQVAAGPRDDPYRFVGQQGVQAEPAVADLYLMGQRYYDASTGRFITTDPLPGTLQHPRTQHRYDYALDNPLRYSDPLGLRASVKGSARATTPQQRDEEFWARTDPQGYAAYVAEQNRQAGMSWWEKAAEEAKKFYDNSKGLVEGCGIIYYPPEKGKGFQVKTPHVTGGTGDINPEQPLPPGYDYAFTPEGEVRILVPGQELPPGLLSYDEYRKRHP